MTETHFAEKARTPLGDGNWLGDPDVVLGRDSHGEFGYGEVIIGRRVIRVVVVVGSRVGLFGFGGGRRRRSGTRVGRRGD